jgi:hypothetical protein
MTTALTLPMTAIAQGKRTKGLDEGAVREKCRAEAVGYGVNKSAQITACVQRAKGR